MPGKKKRKLPEGAKVIPLETQIYELQQPEYSIEFGQGEVEPLPEFEFGQGEIVDPRIEKRDKLFEKIDRQRDPRAKKRDELFENLKYRTKQFQGAGSTAEFSGDPNAFGKRGALKKAREAQLIRDKHGMVGTLADEIRSRPTGMQTYVTPDGRRVVAPNFNPRDPMETPQSFLDEVLEYLKD